MLTQFGRATGRHTETFVTTTASNDPFLADEDELIVVLVQCNDGDDLWQTVLVICTEKQFYSLRTS